MRVAPPDHDGIVTLLRRAVADAQQLASAEVALYKSRAFAALAEAKQAIVFGLAAIICAHLASIALVVGFLLILQRALGAGWATVIVVGVLLLGGALSGWLAYGHVKRMTAKGKQV